MSPPNRRRTRRSAQGLVTILLTDIESSVRATQRLGDEGAQEMVHVHNTIVRRALALNGGTEVKHTGDGILATFPSARRAVTCAVAIQEASTFHNEIHPELAFSLRIGLNAGEPVAEDQDIFGTAVQLAARVCARAEPGKILASDVVRQLVAGKGLLFTDIGPVELKGFEDSVRLFEISAEAGGADGLIHEHEKTLWPLIPVATPVRAAMGIAGLASILAAVTAVALLVSGGDGGESPPGDDAVAAASPSPSQVGSPIPSASSPDLAFTPADAEDIRDLIDRYNAKTIEALRTLSLAGLDAIAISDASTRLATAVADLDSRDLVVESTRESIDVGDPATTSAGQASAGTVGIWTSCTLRRETRELIEGKRTSYAETYHFVRSGGRWYVEQVEAEVLSEDAFEGCEACGALRTGCEAVVTNVAPLNLFVREAPNRQGQVKGRLPQETKACVTGDSQVADGLTWWPVRATIPTGNVEGWSADREPDPPHAVLLTPTGQRCQ